MLGLILRQCTERCFSLVRDMDESNMTSIAQPINIVPSSSSSGTLVVLGLSSSLLSTPEETSQFIEEPSTLPPHEAQGSIVPWSAARPISLTWHPEYSSSASPRHPSLLSFERTLGTGVDTSTHYDAVPSSIDYRIPSLPRTPQQAHLVFGTGDYS